MERLFVAVVPPPPVVHRIRTIERPPDADVRWVPEHQWHVTLRFLADADPEAAIGALGQVDHPSAFVEIGPAVGRLGDRVICLPVSGVDELAAAVTTATDDLGTPSPPERFRGHLTLGRARGDDVDVSMVGQPFAARFVADRISLFSSTQDADGHHHEPLAEWPLGSDRDLT